MEAYKNIRKAVKKILNEEFKSIISEAVIYLSYKSIPAGIRNWVKSYSKKDVQKYKIIQGNSTVQIREPWHIANSTTYQFFKLTDNNAEPVGNPLGRSGWESDSPQGRAAGEEKTGKVTIPDGFVLVEYGTYPERVEIYTGENAQALLPDKQKQEDLSATELIILAAARGLKSFARPKFKDEWYDKLAEKGLLRKNRSITIDGENLLQDPEIKEKVKAALELYNKKTGRYLSLYL